MTDEVKPEIESLEVPDETTQIDVQDSAENETVTEKEPEVVDVADSEEAKEPSPDKVEKKHTFVKRPRKATRAVNRQLQEQRLEIAELRETNKQILEAIKGSVAPNPAPENIPQGTPSQITANDKKVIENWEADLTEAEENSPEVFESISKIQNNRSPISYLTNETKTALLADEKLSPYDVHELATNYHDELTGLVDKNLSSSQELRQIRRWIDEGSHLRRDKSAPKGTPKVAPKPMGVLKGKPETVRKLSSQAETKAYHEKAFGNA